MSAWWLVLGLERPTTDWREVEAAYKRIHPSVSVLWTNDEARAAEVESAREEGFRWCQDAAAGVVRG